MRWFAVDGKIQISNSVITNVCTCTFCDGQYGENCPSIFRNNLIKKIFGLTLFNDAFENIEMFSSRALTETLVEPGLIDVRNVSVSCSNLIIFDFQ